MSSHTENGALPPYPHLLVIERARIHQEELFADWERARARQELRKIALLESVQPTYRSSRPVPPSAVSSAELGRFFHLQIGQSMTLLIPENGVI